ncbi:MAG: hypothetical protein FJ150_08975 [Euryarchaeota archaeon]|nr:hypothetical protein [Euryarchaeota archaeon]
MSVRKFGSIRIGHNEILFLIGDSGTLGIAKASKNKEIFIGMPDNDEIIMFLEPEDLIVVSAFDTGAEIEEGIRCMLYLLREVDSPIVVLPENHPTSRRLKMVVAAGDHIRLDCDITPGTHPEQDILCACQDLSGIEITASPEGVEINGSVKKFKVEKFI